MTEGPPQQRRPPDLRVGVPGDVLAEAARALGRSVRRSTARYGNGPQTAGFATSAGTWLRIQWRRRDAPVSPAWSGLEAASALRAVSRPELLRSFSWADEDRDLVWRAEEMTMAPSPVVAPGGSAETDPGIPGAWWASLRASLAALAGHRTSRTGMSQEHLSRRIAEVYGDTVDTAVGEWATAHADLHWGNLTAPGCWILDWEDWGQAPRGLDAATLWGFSLGVPALADRVKLEFAADLASRSGKLSRLLFCANAERAARRGARPVPFTAPARHAGRRLAHELVT